MTCAGLTSHRSRTCLLALAITWCGASAGLTQEAVGAAVGPPAATAADLDGRWTFEWPIEEVVTFGTTGEPPTARIQQMVLDLRVRERGVLTGTVTVGLRMPLTVIQPWHRVEIADGLVNGRAISFGAWKFDGYRNRLRYEGTLDGGALILTVTRDTPTGPVRTVTTARRMRN